MRPDWGRTLNTYPRHFTRVFGRVRRLEKKYDKLSSELSRAVKELERLQFDSITGKAVLAETEAYARNVS